MTLKDIFKISATFLVALLPLAAQTSTKAKLPVFVSILPQVQFVERIGGDRVQVEVLIGPGQSPHSYEPTPKQMARLAQSKAFFSVGIPLEKNLLAKFKKSQAQLAIIETQKGVPLRDMEGACCDDHHHHHDTSDAKDPHIWMSPRLVKLQAKNICQGLIQLDPAGKPIFERNLENFIQELDKADKRISQQLAPFKGHKIYVFHPAFGYFTDAYGLVQVPIELAGKEPSPKQLARLVAQAKQDKVKVMFVQPQFSNKSAIAIAASIGGTVTAMDPLERNYLKNLDNMAHAIQKGLQPSH